MNGMLSLAKRNIVSYFRNPGAVLGSLMAVLIVLFLFVFFLKDMLVTEQPDIPGIGHLIDSWVLAGIVGIVSVTTSAGCLQTMIEDRTSGKDRDLLVTPLKPQSIAWGYVLSTFFVAFSMSVLAFEISVAYLAATGCPMDAGDMAVSALLIVPSALSGSIIVYAIVSFFRSTTLFSAFNVILGVLIGVLAGIYMPLSMFADSIQVIATLLPVTHRASLFRRYMCSGIPDDIFEGAPQDVIDQAMADNSITLNLGDYVFTPETSLLFVAGVTALFFIIAVIGIRKRA